MTQKERMEQGLLYDTYDEEIAALQKQYVERMWEFNQLRPSQRAEKEAYMKEVFAECGEGCYLELPFRSNWGGHHVHFGNGVYGNYNLTMCDDAHIYVGNRVLFGPNVVVTTSSHSLEPELRKAAIAFAREIHIGDNTWIGAGSIILPGVTIGKNTVIGAGSVVTRDIPDGVLAMGTPCRVIREIDERDKEFYFRSERIDWDNFTQICEERNKPFNT